MTREQIASSLAEALGGSATASGHIVTYDSDLFTLQLDVTDVYSVKEAVMLKGSSLEDAIKLGESCQQCDYVISEELDRLQKRLRYVVLDEALHKMRAEFPGQWKYSQRRDAIQMQDENGVITFVMSNDFSVKAFESPEPTADIEAMKEKAETLRVKLSELIDEHRSSAV